MPPSVAIAAIGVLLAHGFLSSPAEMRPLAERLRPGLKCLLVSGYAEDSLQDSQAKIPNSIFLPKPFSLVELTSTVQSQLQ